MRRLVKIALVVLGIRAFLRWRKRRRAEAAGVAASQTPTVSDPADELRRKLAESRVDESDAEPEEVPDVSVEDRRAEIHEQGRAAVDEMKPSSED